MQNGQDELKVSYCIEIDPMRSTSSEVTQLIQALISRGAIKVDIVTNYDGTKTFLMAEVLFKEVSNFREEIIRQKLELIISQLKFRYTIIQ